MTIEEFAEMEYIRKRLELLGLKYDHSSGGFPDIEVTLAEVADIDAFIQSLRTVHKVYGRD